MHTQQWHVVEFSCSHVFSLSSFKMWCLTSKQYGLETSLGSRKCLDLTKWSLSLDEKPYKAFVSATSKTETPISFLLKAFHHGLLCFPAALSARILSLIAALRPPLLPLCRTLIDKDVSIPPETFRKHVDASLSYINRALKQMSRLFLVEDLVDSLKVSSSDPQLLSTVIIRPLVGSNPTLSMKTPLQGAAFYSSSWSFHQSNHRHNPFYIFQIHPMSYACLVWCIGGEKNQNRWLATRQLKTGHIVHPAVMRVICFTDL